MLAREELIARDELQIARCMLLGCTFVYNDYGHPERRNARKYYQCNYTAIAGDFPIYRTGHGHSEAEAAYDYLRRYNPELLVP